MTDCWNNVTVYGPSAEIVRFRRLCIDLPPGSDPQNVSGGWDGYEAYIGFDGVMPAEPGRDPRGAKGAYAWNYREHAPEPGKWRFAFDTDGEFPEGVFADFAALFQALRFDCDCIDALDNYMGCGWFNTPPGGEPFRQDMDVPADYWTGGGSTKRTPEADAKHTALVEALLDAAREADLRRSMF